LVWANRLNMLFRIIWSTAFIRAYLKLHGNGLVMSSLMPRPATVALGAGIYAILFQVTSTFNGTITDLLKSGVVAAIFAISLAISERVYIRECYQSLRG